MKKFFAILLALVMVLSLSVTAFAANVTVPNGDHTYVAYQIFTGSQSESEGALGNVAWGTGINASSFLTALKNVNDGTFANGTNPSAEGYKANVFTDITYDSGNADASAKLVAEALSGFADSSAAAEKFAKLALANKAGNGTTLASGENELTDGYYLIVDTTNVSGVDDVANPALLQVTRDITIASKTNKPTVDKQVQDETADAEAGSTGGWGETADHAINESFQFKLTAHLPAETGFDRYAAYEVKFTDTWSEGVTYEDIVSITVDGVSVTNDASLDIDTINRKMIIDIPNVKTIFGVDLSDGADVIVIYKAHLNEKAAVAKQTPANTDDDNQNKVYLEYSNKPDGTGLGKTAEDTVYVFTYEVDNTKYKDSVADSNKLGGAGFRLYKSDGETEINLIFDDTKNAYRPVTSTETGVEMTSASGTGVFNIIGLDAGTYVLRETTTPNGFNTCEDITIEISATHKENDDNVSATVTLTNSSNMTNPIVNRSGSVLPETGGIGTTIFYVVGSLLVLAAGVLLITKKRMASRG